MTSSVESPYLPSSEGTEALDSGNPANDTLGDMFKLVNSTPNGYNSNISHQKTVFDGQMKKHESSNSSEYKSDTKHSSDHVKRKDGEIGEKKHLDKSSEKLSNSSHSKPSDKSASHKSSENSKPKDISQHKEKKHHDHSKTNDVDKLKSESKIKDKSVEKSTHDSSKKLDKSKSDKPKEKKDGISEHKKDGHSEHKHKKDGHSSEHKIKDKTKEHDKHVSKEKVKSDESKAGEKPKEKSDKLKEKSDKPKEKSVDKLKDDKAKDKTEKPKILEDKHKEKGDRPKEKIDKPKDKLDKPKDKSDKPKEKLDKPKEKSDKPKEKSDKPKEKSDKPKDKVDRPKDKVDRPKDKVDKPKDKVDKPKDKVDKPKDKVDKPKEKSEKPKEKSDKPKEASDKPKEASDKPKEASDKQKEKSDKPKDKADKPKEKSDKPKEKIDKKDKSDIPRDKNEKSKERSDKVKDKSEKPKDKSETKEKTEKPHKVIVKREDSPEKKPDKPNVMKNVESGIKKENSDMSPKIKSELVSPIKPPMTIISETISTNVVKEEHYDDEDDDEPLAARMPRTESKKAAKRIKEESDYEDEYYDEDEPPSPKPKSKKAKTEGPGSRKRKVDSDDDYDSDYIKPKKKAKKVAKKGVKKESITPKKEPISPKKEYESPTKTPTKKRGKKEEEGQDVWKWWEEEKNPTGMKWRTLQHSGPVFAPGYVRVPKAVKFYYNGKHMPLSEETEEVAGFYGKMLDHDYTSKDSFNTNFFKDWRKVMTPEEKESIVDLKKCNFSDFNVYYKRLSEERKAMSKEEKNEIKKQNEALVQQYGFCIIDGHKQKIGNFKIEPPGLFRGRGEHPKMGKLKRRVMPEDISINIGEDAKVPEPPAGHKWKDVRHDHSVTWLASWAENILGSVKYIMLNPSSKLKGEKDWQKYETARKLKNFVDRIRDTYHEDFKSKEMKIRQRAVALYFIDKLALRAGNEKDEDTADTVGCCSLRVEHITLDEEKDGKEYVVSFDFLGKDSIRYVNSVAVEKRAFKNLKLFMENKKPQDDVFDRLNTAILNKYLNELMEGLTAKVFRTFNASKTLQEQLDLLTKEEMSIPEKILAYNRANRAVAILCNHQRAVPKTFGKSMENLKNKIDEKIQQITEYKKEVKKAKADAKGSGKDKAIYEKKRKRLQQLEEQLKKLDVQATDKEENKQIALGTSKLNYLDPRISVAWCKKWEVPVEKIYNRTQRDKFRWAIEMAGPEYVF